MIYLYRLTFLLVVSFWLFTVPLVHSQGAVSDIQSLKLSDRVIIKQQINQTIELAVKRDFSALDKAISYKKVTNDEDDIARFFPMIRLDSIGQIFIKNCFIEQHSGFKVYGCVTPRFIGNQLQISIDTQQVVDNCRGNDQLCGSESMFRYDFQLNKDRQLQLVNFLAAG